jgi:iron complex outermembrane receptor protein
LEYDPSQAWRDGAIGIYSVLRGINGSESLSAVYAEANLPFLKTLEANVAVRHDRYQSAGNTTNPKLGIIYRPLDTLMFRGTYSTAFRAPTLSQQFNDGRGGFGSSRDPKRCLEGNVHFTQSCDGSVLSLLSGSKDLKPESAKMFNLGLVIEPIKNTSFGLTYWNIKWNDRVESLDNDTVLAGEDGPYKNNVTRYAISDDDRTFYAALSAAEKAKLGPLVGKLKEVRAGLINRSKVQTDGFDVDGSVLLKTDTNGKFKFFSEATFTRHYDSSLLPDDPYINCPDNTACEAGEYGTPRVLAKMGVSWDKADWSMTTVANYTGAFKVDRSPTLTNNSYYDQYAEGLKISSSTLIDVSGSFSGFKNLTLRAGINNLFNKDPAFDPASALGYNSSWGNPRGRYLYVSATYRLK